MTCSSLRYSHKSEKQCPKNSCLLCPSTLQHHQPSFPPPPMAVMNSSEKREKDHLMVQVKEHYIGNQQPTVKQEPEDDLQAETDQQTASPVVMEGKVGRNLLFHQASRENKKGTVHIPFESTTEISRDAEPRSKRIIKRKIILDPSVTPSTSTGKQRKKRPRKMDKVSTARTQKPRAESPEAQDTENENISSSRKSTVGFTCGYCGKHLKRVDYYRLHIMKHTGEMPYKCPHCKNAYRTRWRLTQHLRTHTNNLPYHCPYCTYCGNRSDYLASHVKRIHRVRR